VIFVHRKKVYGPVARARLGKGRPQWLPLHQPSRVAIVIEGSHCNQGITLKTPRGGILSAMGIFVRRDKPA
jgi:hypothetical protein